MAKSKFSKYLEKAGLTNREVVEILQPHFPKFTKIQCSMLTHPDQYGVQLTPEAKKFLPVPPSKPKGCKPKTGGSKIVHCSECVHLMEYQGDVKDATGAFGDCRIRLLQSTDESFVRRKATDFCSDGGKRE